MEQSGKYTPSLGTDPLPISAVDFLLTAQLAVAWAGEKGEQPRLGWWRSDLVSEYGGEDLFQRLLPNTWQWATLQGVRAAAMRRDSEIRAHDHDPDRVLSLFRLGFEIDERAGERLQQLKQSGQTPAAALPGLADVVVPNWDAARFADWVGGHGGTKFVASPVGRWIKGPPPGTLDLLVRRLVSALVPLADEYPLPHYRRAS